MSDQRLSAEAVKNILLQFRETSPDLIPDSTIDLLEGHIAVLEAELKADECSDKMFTRAAMRGHLADLGITETVKVENGVIEVVWKNERAEKAEAILTMLRIAELKHVQQIATQQAELAAAQERTSEP